LLCCLLQLPLASVRPPVEEEGGYTGVQAPKRKRVQETPVVEEAPPKVHLGGGGESVTRSYSRHTSLALPARLAAAECAWCRACCSQLVCSIVSGPVMGCWYSRERPTCCSCLLPLTSDWYEQQQPPSRLVASSILQKDCLMQHSGSLKQHSPTVSPVHLPPPPKNTHTLNPHSG
jgi:hypothetical protein